MIIHPLVIIVTTHIHAHTYLQKTLTQHSLDKHL